jgi:beta-N-acetylhexosaminidase
MVGRRRCRRTVALGLLAAATLTLSLSVALTGTSAGSASTTTAKALTTAATCVPVGQWSTRRLAAQTVIVPAQETEVATVDTEVAHGAGGVILFGSSAPADLGSQITALRGLVPGHLGLLVMTDEEGGGVQRMPNLVGSLPWARYMGRHWTRTEIRTHVAKVATRMARYGVNTNLAPVVDVDGRDVPPSSTDPDGWRSFSGRTARVTRDGMAYLRGVRAGGVIPVLKHFPGLGGASRNTDYGTAYTLPWSTLQTVGLPPFVAGIRAGAPAIMVSNAIVPGLTRLPASLSPAAIRGELIRTLHFGGLIITDSLSAGAISQAGFHVPRAAVHAIHAGADMIMYSAATPAGAVRTFRAIIAAEIAAVTRGTLARPRLIAAARAALRVRHINTC